MVHDGPVTLAAYWVHWTIGHLADTGASIDVVLGRWGEGATADDRLAVKLVHRQQADGGPALMVVDAPGKPSLASHALRREEVIGTPLAANLFALVDAIYEQDDRFF